MTAAPPSPSLALAEFRNDPALFFRVVWPEARVWQKQHDIMLSVRDNYRTVVCSAIEMGKDWIAARLILWFYCTRFPCKVLATSTTFSQLTGALWGEIDRAIREAKMDLGLKKTKTQLQRLDVKGKPYADDWVRLRAATKEEAFSGLHLVHPEGVPCVLIVLDEVSGISDGLCETLEGQAHVILAIGNPLQLGGYFVRQIRNGDQPDAVTPGRFRNRVIFIDAEESPNVAAGKKWEAEGRPTEEPPTVFPGVMTYRKYRNFLADQDPYWINTRLHGKLSTRKGRLYDAAWFLHFTEHWMKVGGEKRAMFVLQQGGEERRVWQHDCWWFQTCDTAQKDGQDNDFTCVLTACITPFPVCLLIVDVRRERLQIPFQFGMLMEQRSKFPMVGGQGGQAVEDKVSGTGLIQEARLRGIPFRPLKADISKTARHAAVTMAYESGIVYHHAGRPWLPDFELELADLPDGEHDDQGDCLAYAGLIFQEHNFEATLGDESLVAWPPPQRREEDEEEQQGLSLAEQLTGHRIGRTQFKVGGRTIEFDDD